MFFQLAATLIPVLLFGTAVTSLRPAFVFSRIRSRRGQLRVVIGATLFVSFALVAEIVAIELSVSASPVSAEKLTVVVLALVLSVGVIGFAVLVPWYDEFHAAGWLPAIALTGYVLLLFGGGTVLSRSALDAEYGRSQCRVSVLTAMADDIVSDLSRNTALLNRIADLSYKRRGLLRNRRIPPGERKARAFLLKSRIDSAEVESRAILNFVRIKTERYVEIENGGPAPGC